MAQKKDLGAHQVKSCGAPFVLEFTESNIPFLKCSGCGYEIKDWINWQEKYSKLWMDENAWASASDAIACVLGYFCYKYKEAYGTDYSLTLGSSGLFRGAEGTLVRRLLGNFPAGAKQVKPYIDWYFKNKVENKKKKILNISGIVSTPVINQYRHALQLEKRISRDTKLPEKMLAWITANTPNLTSKVQLEDYGDLKNLLTFWSSSNRSDPDIARYVQELQTRGTVLSDFTIKGYIE